MRAEKAEMESSEISRKTGETRSKGVFVRLTKTEQERLKKLSKQSGISVSQLLRTGALGQLDTLPAFQKLPAEVSTQLAKLDRLTTALWYISQRADANTVYAQEIREVVYEVGAISQQVNQFCQQNKTRFSAVTLLDRLILELQQAETSPMLAGDLLDALQVLRTSYQTPLYP